MTEWATHERFNALLEFHELFNVRRVSDERAMAIVGAAFLDTRLEEILSDFMVDDEKEVRKLLAYDQPMGTFSNRIAATYCMGLICKTVRDDLRIIARIRNRFAHQLKATFDVEPVRGLCMSLRWHEHGMMMRAPREASPRDIYEVSVNQLITYLDGPANFHARSNRRNISNEDEGGPTLLR